MDTHDRLYKILAHRGAGSRRDIKLWCQRGLVQVDGTVEKNPDARISLNASLTVDGKQIVPLPLFVMYHKPRGMISTLDDNWGRTGLENVLPEAWQGRLHPVGRLDADTTGLLLFCSDGQYTQRLLHPKREIEREYIARVECPPGRGIDGPALTAQLSAGVETTDGVVVAHVVDVRGDTVQLIVTEGKYHMVRRILANAGYPVVDLHRIRYGGFGLGDLPEGQWRVVVEEEYAWISKA